MRDQFALGHDSGATTGKLALHPLKNLNVPAPPRQHDAGQQSAHRAADNQRAALPHHAKPGFFLSYFLSREGFLYCANK